MSSKQQELYKYKTQQVILLSVMILSILGLFYFFNENNEKKKEVEDMRDQIKELSQITEYQKRDVDSLKNVLLDSCYKLIKENESDSAKNKELLVTVDSILNECKPYPNGTTKAISSQIRIGRGKKNWFAILASFYTGPQDAFLELSKIQEHIPDFKDSLFVFKAYDVYGKDVWIVTLGGYLEEEEAKRRVCIAQKNKNLRNDSYVWASNVWGKALSSEDFIDKLK